MNCSLTTWIGLIVTAIPAIATALIAYLVAKITQRQWWTSREKLRFDLYQRRYAIYLKVWNLQDALLFWKSIPQEKKEDLIGGFRAAFEESRFLFPPKSGVHKLLQEIWDHAFRINNSEAEIEAWGLAFPKERVLVALQRAEHVNWMLGALSPVVLAMAPYLEFHEF